MTREEIEAADDLALSQHLDARGHGDHRWEKHAHIFSDDLKKLGALFTHIPSKQMSLTATKGSLEFTTPNHDIMFGDTLHSNLLPAGTRVGHILHVDEGDVKMRGTLVLPDGKTAVDVDSGTDATATHEMVIYGSTIAAALDDFHGRFHAKGPGRIVFLTTDEKRAKALALLDAEAK